MVRFSFKLSDGFIKLEEQIATRFQLKLGSFSLKYTDEEADMILIACDSSLSVSVGDFTLPDGRQTAIRLVNVYQVLSDGAEKICNSLRQDWLPSVSIRHVTLFITGQSSKLKEELTDFKRKLKRAATNADSARTSATAGHVGMSSVGWLCHVALYNSQLWLI
ncbi:PB1 domain, RWP-RK domain, Lambda repressor-like, DNA-binding domain protein [Artemisia annua]|uniref:PB1 domain, RWP-RK domain, Lambda repressor-like, DNA-binding domain protein n=1 Tax=Artemisia annua TaxID=35608 RepID=A0A2U1LT26_ARTAN|nr:PB1 domain, RWP-RK domain, Lambda repressor-like, DNA-binding domain protein [Artemisia annua]